MPAEPEVAAVVVTDGDNSTGGDSNEQATFGAMLAEASQPEGGAPVDGAPATDSLPGDSTPTASAFDNAVGAAVEGEQSPVVQGDEPGTVRSLLTQAGYDLANVPDETIAQSYIQTVQQNHQLQQQIEQINRQVQPLQQFAQLGQQVYPHLQEFQAFMASKQQAGAPAQPQQAAPATGGFKPQPEFNQNWLRLVTRDEATGRFVGITPEVPLDIVNKVNAYTEWRQEAGDYFIQNAAQFTPEAIEQRAREAARAEFQQMQAAQQQQWQEQQQQHFQQQQEHYSRNAISELAPWICKMHNGQPVINPVTRQLELSDDGKYYVQCVQELHVGSEGKMPVNEQDRIARLMLNAHIAQRQPQASAQNGAATASQQQVVDKRDQFTQRNGAPQRRPQQNGSHLRAVASPAAPAQNSRLDFGAMLDEGLLQATGRTN